MAYNEALKLGCTFITTITLKYLGASLNTMGRCSEAIELYITYIERMVNEFGKVLPFIGVVYLGLAELYYERNELDKAKEYIESGMELCRSISYGWNQNIEIINARIKFAAGEKETAIKCLEQTLTAARSRNIPGLTLGCIAILAELLFRAGEARRAEKLEEELKSRIEDIDKQKEVLLPYARLLIYRHNGRAARELLASLEAEAARSQKLREQIEVYVLFAEAYYSDGDYVNTDVYIDKAAELAEPQGYYRLFLEDEELMKGILSHRTKERGQFLHKIAEYLNVPVQEEINPEEEHKETSYPRQESLSRLEYTDKLSKREIEILNLIAEGMSNNEIAKVLYISINTAQWHISHIYSKLGVKSRTQAVLKARESGII
jgi:LuxR family maltose regulon positive regulatory protein